MIAERRRRILEEARAHGIVSLHGLSEQLATSEPTIRRDLRTMAAQGLLRRTHGGALLRTGGAHEPTYSEKSGQASAEKAAIARLAAKSVRSGDAILIGPGTTTLALARLLVDRADLTVVTNSLVVAQALTPASGVEVVMTGGTLRRSIHALTGPAAEQTLAGLRMPRLFLSGNGLTVSRGLTTPNMMVAATDRALAAAAREVVVLVDYTKVGVETMCQTVPVESMAQLITDDSADAAYVDRLREAGVDVQIASIN
jgi:DeoR/GlpR family transcriptional regulator of sugar metabolism